MDKNIYSFRGIELVHRIDNTAQAHMLEHKDGNSPWVGWNLPITFQIDGRNFVAQMAMPTLPSVFELVASDNERFELMGAWE